MGNNAFVILCILPGGLAMPLPTPPVNIPLPSTESETSRKDLRQVCGINPGLEIRLASLSARRFGSCDCPG